MSQPSDKPVAAKRQESRFHAGDGLWFRRGADGAVIIESARSGGFWLTAGTWASVVAFVSQDGESSESFAQALAFHGDRVDVVARRT